MEKAELCKVIRTESSKGDGHKSPIRKIVQYWTLEGQLIAETDLANDHCSSNEFCETDTPTTNPLCKN